MKHLLFSALLLATAGLLSGAAQTNKVCDGILPPNTAYIPVTMDSTAGGITEAQFNAVLDRIQAYYTPVIEKMGARYVIQRNWNDGTSVNAFADRSTAPTGISICLARVSPAIRPITEDGFAARRVS